MSFDDMPQGGERAGQAPGYLVAIAFDEEPRAAEMLYALQDLAKSGDLVLTDAVGIARDMEGSVRIFEAGEHHGASPAGKGALWGVVVGALFAVPVVGLAVGTGVGAFKARATETGITREFQKRVADRLLPGTSAVLVLGHSANREKVLAAVRPLGGTVIHTDLPPDAMEALREALDPTTGQEGAGPAGTVGESPQS